MAKESKRQQRIIKRVMHAFKQGELKSAGNGESVGDEKQALAIALREAGVSRDQARRGRGPTRRELYARARQQKIPGRSKMSKAELEKILH